MIQFASAASGTAFGFATPFEWDVLSVFNQLQFGFDEDLHDLS